MSKDIYIFEVSTANFEQVVLQNSHKIPAVTLFMTASSEPCFVLAEIFSQLAKEFPEQFIFAKVDTDEQTALRDQYQIENVPTITVFQAGEVTLSSEGLLTEDEARVILRGVDIFNVADEMRQQARTKHMAGETEAAIILLSEAIKQAPGNTRVALDMVQIFIDIKQFEQASGLFSKLPESATESDMGKSVSGQLTFHVLAADLAGINSLTIHLAANPDDQQAKFDLAICLTADYQYEQALDQLLALHQQDAAFKDGAAKELLITLIGMLKPNQPEIASRAQRSLSNLLAE